jgi:putative peptidoglycan lipid II flippase
MGGFKDRLARAMRGVLFLALPATVALIALGEPLVTVLYQRGEWTAEDTAATAWALAFYATGIAGFALLEVLSRAFYALADTWTPVRVGVAAMLANIALSLVFIQFIGEPGSLARGPFAGLALANALTTLLEALALWWLLRRRIGGVNDSYVLDGAARAGLAALAMGAVMLLLSAALDGALLTLMVGAAAGGAVFFGTAAALRLDEAVTVPRALLRRVRR